MCGGAAASGHEAAKKGGDEDDRGGEGAREGGRGRVRVRSKVIIYSTWLRSLRLPDPNANRPNRKPLSASADPGRGRRTDGRTDGRRSSSNFRVILRRERRPVCSLVAPPPPSLSAEFGDESIRYRNYISPRTRPPPPPPGPGRVARIGKTELSSQFISHRTF